MYLNDILLALTINLGYALLRFHFQHLSDPMLTVSLETVAKVNACQEGVEIVFLYSVTKCETFVAFF